MRCFLTRGGAVLVEWALLETHVRKPDGTRVGEGGTFYLLDSAGEVARAWKPTSVSVQEHLGTTAYVVEGDAFVSYYHDVAWGREDRPSLSRARELEGLRLLASDQAPPKATVQSAVNRYEAALAKAHAERDRRERERLTRFERALPDLSPDERITLVWRYAGPDVVVYRSTGAEVWREPDWPWMGRDLYRGLRRVAEQKYGTRLMAFEVDVPAAEYLRFDND
jgi:hypothetical protein